MANKARVVFALKGSAVERITKKLADIDQKIATQSLQRGMREACQLVTKAAKANVPKRTGLLRKSIGWKVKTYPSKTIVGIVGPRKGYRSIIRGKAVNPVKYAHLVEFGRAAVKAGVARRKSTKSRLLSDGTTVFGKEVKAVAARPFLRPAYEATRGRIGAILMRNLNAGLKAVAKG